MHPDPLSKVLEQNAVGNAQALLNAQQIIVGDAQQNFVGNQLRVAIERW